MCIFWPSGYVVCLFWLLVGTWDGGHGRVGIALKAGGLGWTDPNQDAGWIDTCLSDDRFLELQQEKRGAVHPLFHPLSTPGGALSLWVPDWMHSKHLGTDQSLLGSTLKYLVDRIDYIQTKKR